MKTSPSPVAKKTLWMLLAIILLGAAIFWSWLCLFDYSLLGSENSKHLFMAYTMCMLSQEPGGWLPALNTRPYPPLFYLPAALLCRLTGNMSEPLALLSIVPFIMLLALACFVLAKQMRLPDFEALTATFVIQTAAYQTLRTTGYISEYAILPFCVLALCLLFYSDFLKRTPGSLLLGVTCALALLCKWTFLVYFAMPCLVIAWIILRQRHQRSKRLRNLVWCLVLTQLLAYTWYGAEFVHGGVSDGTNLQSMVMLFIQGTSTDSVKHADRVNNFSQGSLWEQGPKALLRNVYLDGLPVHLIGISFIGVFWAIFCLWRRKDKSLSEENRQTAHYRLLALLLAALFPVILFSCYPSRVLCGLTGECIRYVSPTAPLFMVLGLTIFPSLGVMRRPLLIILNAIAVLTAIGWVFPPNPFYDQNHLFLPRMDGLTHYRFADPLGIITAPKQTPLGRVASQINEKYKQGYHPICLTYRQSDYDPVMVEFYGQSHNPYLIYYVIESPHLFTHQHKPASMEEARALPYPLFIIQDYNCYADFEPDWPDFPHNRWQIVNVQRNNKQIIAEIFKATRRTPEAPQYVDSFEQPGGQELYYFGDENIWKYIHDMPELSEDNPAD